MVDHHFSIGQNDDESGVKLFKYTSETRNSTLERGERLLNKYGQTGLDSDKYYGAS